MDLYTEGTWVGVFVVPVLGVRSPVQESHGERGEVQVGVVDLQVSLFSL